MRIALTARDGTRSHPFDRRTFIRSTLAAIIGAGFAGSLNATPPGIQGRTAPLLHVPYWIDGDAQAMSFDPRTLQAHWVVLNDFHLSATRFIDWLGPQLET